MGTGLFLMEARKWARLSDLIRAGTNIIRTRAHTTGTLVITSAGTLIPSPSAEGKRRDDKEMDIDKGENEADLHRIRWEL